MKTMKKTAWIALFVGSLAFVACNSQSGGDGHNHDHTEHDHNHDGHDHHDHDHQGQELETPLDTLRVGDTIGETSN